MSRSVNKRPEQNRIAEAPPVSSADLLEFQSDFSVTDSELATLLGYQDQSQIVRHWKAGQKGGEPFIMVPSARRAFHYLKALMSIYSEGHMLPDQVEYLIKSAIPGWVP